MAAKIAVSPQYPFQGVDTDSDDAESAVGSNGVECDVDLPSGFLPNNRPALVEETCGGGFSICDAVGARDWRIEYVRCMFEGCRGSLRVVCLWA